MIGFINAISFLFFFYATCAKLTESSDCVVTASFISLYILTYHDHLMKNASPLATESLTDTDTVSDDIIY